MLERFAEDADGTLVLFSEWTTMPDGRLQLRFTLPDESALNGLAATLAKMLVTDGGGTT